MSPFERRRTWRNLASIAVVFVLLALVWSWSGRLDGEALRETTRWALAIVGLFGVSNGFENGLRALKLHAGGDGIELEAGGGE